MLLARLEQHTNCTASRSRVLRVQRSCSQTRWDLALLVSHLRNVIPSILVSLWKSNVWMRSTSTPNTRELLRSFAKEVERFRMSREFRNVTSTHQRKQNHQYS